MTHPNPQRIRELVAAMREVQKSHPAGIVKMVSPEMPSCGTPGCHAGECHMALNLITEPVSDYWFYEEKGRITRFLFDGAKSSNEELGAWAYTNPDIWGGDHGDAMFVSCVAFNQETDNFPPSVIADWWEGVADRLEAHLGIDDNAAAMVLTGIIVYFLMGGFV